MAKTLIQAPTLDCDATTFLDNNREIHARMRSERAVIANLIDYLAEAGYAVRAASDGEQRHKVSDMKAAMEVIFSVDEAWLFVKHPDQARGQTIFIVLGNDGWDCVADYSTADGFDEIMAGFDFDQFDTRG